MGQAGGDFREFVAARYGRLLRTAYLLTGNRVDAEDLVQTALLKVMRSWHRIREAPEAYIRRTMVNHLISRSRLRRVTELLMSRQPEPPPQPAPDLGLRDELWRALSTLPAQMRAVLVLRYWEDLSEAETAEALDCAVGSVKSQASRGLRRLRELLGQSADFTSTGFVPVKRQA